MFKDFRFNFNVGKHYPNPNNSKQQFYPHVITIIDDDFTETITTDVLGNGVQAFSVWKGCVQALIVIYSKRQLDVLPNLFLLMKHFVFGTGYTNLSFEEIAEELLEFVPDYKQYHMDLIKYFQQRVFW